MVFEIWNFQRGAGAFSWYLQHFQPPPPSKNNTKFQIYSSLALDLELWYLPHFQPPPPLKTHTKFPGIPWLGYGFGIFKGGQVHVHGIYSTSSLPPLKNLPSALPGAIDSTQCSEALAGSDAGFAAMGWKAPMRKSILERSTFQFGFLWCWLFSTGFIARNCYIRRLCRGMPPWSCILDPLFSWATCRNEAEANWKSAAAFLASSIVQVLNWNDVAARAPMYFDSFVKAQAIQYGIQVSWQLFALVPQKDKCSCKAKIHTFCETVIKTTPPLLPNPDAPDSWIQAEDSWKDGKRKNGKGCLGVMGFGRFFNSFDVYRCMWGGGRFLFRNLFARAPPHSKKYSIIPPAPTPLPP